MAQISENTMKEWKYLIYKKQELLPDGVPEDGFWQVLEEVKQHGITITEAEGNLAAFLASNKIRPESALVIAVTDASLQELKSFSAASVGLKTAAYPSEGLYGADILAEGLAGIDYDFLKRVYQRKHNIPWRIAETKRCYLREMTLSDLPDLYVLYEGRGMTDYMEPLHEWKEETEYAKAYIENMYRFYGFGMWLVKERGTHALIGRAGFHLLEWEGETLLEMGYAIAASCQRMGYATEVCRALIAYVLEEELGFSKIHCFVQKENKASAALLNKLGFMFCGDCLRDGREMKRYVLEV